MALLAGGVEDCIGFVRQLIHFRAVAYITFAVSIKIAKIL